jgi:hypothetical protein
VNARTRDSPRPAHLCLTDLDQHYGYRITSLSVFLRCCLDGSRNRGGRLRDAWPGGPVGGPRCLPWPNAADTSGRGRPTFSGGVGGPSRPLPGRPDARRQTGGPDRVGGPPAPAQMASAKARSSRSGSANTSSQNRVSVHCCEPGGSVVVASIETTAGMNGSCLLPLHHAVVRR